MCVPGQVASSVESYFDKLDAIERAVSGALHRAHHVLSLLRVCVVLMMCSRVQPLKRRLKRSRLCVLMMSKARQSVLCAGTC